MKLTESQIIQEAQYSIPYHYIPERNRNIFSQTQYWSWGMRYMAGIDLVLSVLGREKFTSILDVGCGDGRFLREVMHRYSDPESLGIDYSERAIAFAKAFNPGIDYACIDITSGSLEGRYDVVTMVEVLEHIPLEQVPQFLKSVAIAIVGQGRLILTVPHANKPVQAKHFQHFTSRTLRESLEPFFKVEEIMPFDHMSRLTGWMSRILGHRGQNYIITNQRLNYMLYKRILNGCLNQQPEERCGRLLLIAQPR